MKVAFFTYPSAFQSIGGGEILMLRLSAALRRKGVDVKFFDIWKDSITSFDVLHVFSCQSECLGLSQMARAVGVPVAVHTIAFETWASVWYGVPPSRRLSSAIRFLIKKAFPRTGSPRRSMLTNASLLFPNSKLEAAYLERHFAVPAADMCAVPNGVDLPAGPADPALFRRMSGIEGDFVLCSGRVEPRKNQLRFIEAANRLNLPVVVLGDAVKGYEDYFAQCKRAAKPHIRFVSRLSPDSGELQSAYAAAALVVLPAYVETPGLVGLEAALLGTRVCVTTGGPTREYYGDDVTYLNPSSADSILNAMRTALARPASSALKERILASYTWDAVADRVIEGYARVVSTAKSPKGKS